MSATPTKHARTKQAEFWLITFAHYCFPGGEEKGRWIPAATYAGTEARAVTHAEWLWGQLAYDCIVISGPHKQEIPVMEMQTA